jgi:hypothetical protein
MLGTSIDSAGYVLFDDAMDEEVEQFTNLGCCLQERRFFRRTSCRGPLGSQFRDCESIVAKISPFA